MAYDLLGRLVKRIDLYQGAVSNGIGVVSQSTSQCAGNTTTLKYAPDRSRYYRQDSTGSGTTSYTYVDGLYEKVTLPNGQTEERHYLGDVAILTIKNRTATVPGTQQRRYLHQDHLGSVTVITDDYADIVEKFSFDPWGKRRAPNLQTLEQKLGAWNSLSAYQKSNLTLSALTLASTTTNQGFTGHEQMDPVGLIHMGGRVYDAEIGRFISADPFVDDTTNLQALNRYSYVYNNPLSYTDPSGYGVFSSAFKKLKHRVSDIRNVLKKAWNAHIGRPLKSIVRAISKVEGLQQLVSIAITIFVPTCQTGYCAMAFNSAIAAANGGSIGDIATAAALAYASIKLAPPAPPANPAGSVLSRLQIKSVGGTVAADEAGDEALKRLASNMLKNQAKAIIDTAEKKAQARPEEGQKTEHVLGKPENYIGIDDYRDAGGYHECVYFPQQADGAPITTKWSPGNLVTDKTRRGTWVGTFDKRTLGVRSCIQSSDTLTQDLTPHYAGLESLQLCVQ